MSLKPHPGADPRQPGAQGGGAPAWDRTGAETAPFDPEAGWVPEGIAELFDRPSEERPALVLLAGEDARSGAWAAEAAASLAESLSDRGHRIVLCDLSVEEPELHDLLGTSNLEGMVDVFLFGASLRRVATSAREGAINFVPAGSAVPDAARILTHGRWVRLIEGAATAQATLLLYLPAGYSGSAGLIQRIGAVVPLIASESDAERVLDLPESCLIPAVLVQPGSALAADVGGAARRAAPAPAEVEEHAPSRSASPDPDALEPAPPPGEVVPAGARPGEARPAGAASGAAEAGVASGAAAGGAGSREARAGGAAFPDAGPPGPRPVVSTRRFRKASPSTWLLWTLVLLVVVVGGWFLGRYALDALDRGSAAASATPAEAPSAGSQAAPRSLEQPLPYSVAIEAHQDLTVASERLGGLSAAESSLDFFIAPIVLEDVLYYRVMAGPIADSAAAENVMRRLVAGGHKRSSSAWDIRPTRLAYHLGDFASAAEAESRRTELLESQVPSYLVEIPYSEGGSRYRLYAGAYTSAESAEFLGGLIEEAAGTTPPLVERTGKGIE